MLAELEGINNQKRPMNQRELEDRMITTYGEVQLDNQERKFLSLGPHFSLLEQLQIKQFKVDFQTALTKVRWARHGLETEEVQRYKLETEMEEEEKLERMVHLEQRQFKEETKEVDLGGVRCTNMKTSRRLVFPPGRGTKEEATLEVRKQAWLEIVRKYMEKECNPAGDQKTETQLTRDQLRGKLKLEKRIQKGEIHISASDKGKGIVVMPLSMYETVTRKHTEKDSPVTWKELRETQRKVLYHARALARIFRLGMD